MLCRLRLVTRRICHGSYIQGARACPRISQINTNVLSAGVRRNTGLAVASGAPDKHLKTSVTIYSPARRATTQGMANQGIWLVKFDKEDRRWANPLMGWTSGKQTDASQLTLKFSSEDEAVAYCKKQGFEYKVKQPHEKKKFVKAYADNFKYRAS
mmetsp:Transcript_20876/g.42128  ORF Transcript_20876/g.42128 Transcript_20876/m.42128 type:complete len:155 (-) Transcript_20876:86-550(-)